MNPLVLSTFIFFANFRILKTKKVMFSFCQSLATRTANSPRTAMEHFFSLFFSKNNFFWEPKHVNTAGFTHTHTHKHTHARQYCRLPSTGKSWEKNIRTKSISPPHTHFSLTLSPSHSPHTRTRGGSCLTTALPLLCYYFTTAYSCFTTALLHRDCGLRIKKNPGAPKKQVLPRAGK